MFFFSFPGFKHPPFACLSFISGVTLSEGNNKGLCPMWWAAEAWEIPPNTQTHSQNGSALHAALHVEEYFCSIPCWSSVLIYYGQSPLKACRWLLFSSSLLLAYLLDVLTKERSLKNRGALAVLSRLAQLALVN